MEKAIPLADAISTLLNIPISTKTEMVSLFEAQDRILAQDIIARQNVPCFDRSPYDGYALKGDDTKTASQEMPVTLHIIEEIPAGHAPAKVITPGAASKILTGGMLPEGADCIIKFESTSFTADSVTIFAPVEPGSDVVLAGEDVKKGETLANRGIKISAAMLAVLAAQGYETVEVFEKPRVGVITTGSELQMPGEELQRGKIYNSNLFSIIGSIKNIGATPVSYGIVRDELDEIAQAMSKALEECDCVITTGGASVGDYDFSVRASQKVGANVLFWKTKMKPGGAMVAATKGGKLILSLSGNPSASLMGLHVVGTPYIKKLCGRSDLAAQYVSVKLKNKLRKKSPNGRFLRGHLEIIGGETFFVSHESQGNGDTLSFAGCDMIGKVPAGSPPLEAGEKIEAFFI